MDRRQTPSLNRAALRSLRVLLALAQVFSVLGITTVAVFRPAFLEPLVGAPQQAFAAGNLTGNVFRDYNSNGIRDANETAGVAGVTVTAYDASGSSVGTATAAADGSYVLNLVAVPVNTPLRIEFTALPAPFQPSYHGSNNGTSIQFLTTAVSPLSNVNFGVNAPSDYCQNNPDMVLSCYRNGNNTTSVPSLYKFPYNSSGVGAPPSLATNNQVGSIWGLAYQRDTKKLLSSAILKRHVGLGPNGLGAIYQTTFPAATTSLFVDVTTIGINVGQASVASNAARGLPNSLTTSNVDATTFPQIGKYGIGDIDLSDDGTVLYITNLFDRSAYAITIGNPATTPTSGNVTNLNGPWKTFACTQGVARPWATKVFRDKLYVGAVCTGESGTDTNANLRALVYAYDIPTATWNNTPVMNVPLNYTKGEARVGPRYNPNDTRWHTWTDTYSDAAFYADPSWAPFASRSTPVLSDIEFDATGALIMSFTDRAGMQLGYYNQKPNATGLIADQLSGELLRACPNGSGGWVLENNGSCGGANGGVGNNQGPGGGEFYQGDELPTYHQETVQGGMVQVMGQPDVVVGNMDPININSGGVTWMSNSNGSKTRNMEVYSGANDGTLGTGTTANPLGSFGKAVGLGDIEVLCDSAPIEIGNRVWKDTDSDGIQDAGEPGLAGIQISLQTPTTTLNTTTDANGNYYFANLAPNTAYTLSASTLQSSLIGYTLTTPNANAITSNTAMTDVRDSDAVVVGSTAQIQGFTTGSAGKNNHSLDIGFSPIVPKLSVNKTSSGNGGPLLGGTRITYTIVMTSPDSITQTMPVVSDTLPPGTTFVPGSIQVTGYYTFVMSDSFAAGVSYSGGSGWAGNWTETGDDNNPNEDPPPTGGALGNIYVEPSVCGTGTSNCLSFRGGGAGARNIARTVDLSNVITATVLMNAGAGNLAGGVDPDLRVSVLGGGTSTLGDITASALGAYQFGIPAARYVAGAQLQIAYIPTTGNASGFMDTDDYIVSGVKITTTNPGTSPANLLIAPNNFILSSQYPLTLTYAVTINSPIAIGVGDVHNTVDVNTSQSFTATDVVTDALGTIQIGNYVWVDVDQDGIQDVSETPLNNVQVWLVNSGTGAIVSTTTTNVSGEYYFRDPSVVAGTQYSIVIPLTQTVFLPYKPTIPNNAIYDTEDSDGIQTSPSRVEIGIIAPPINQFDFSYDFGFVLRIYDWGDLPDGVSPTSPDYNTDSTGTQGPRHEIVSGLHIGLLIDDEINGQNNGTATGDDTNSFDDEEGIFLPNFSPGTTSIVRASAQNTLTVPAYLYGFIDFNGDGDFADAGEALSVTVPAGTEGAIFPMTFTAPSNATISQDIGARFRLSTDAGLGPDGNATDGEVEDYLIRVVPTTDFGDLPSQYHVTVAENGPRHTVTVGIKLGSLIDTELDGTHATAADFDDEDVPDRNDEDGVQLPYFQLGQPAPITVSVVNTTGTPVTVYAFVDFNGDGDFSDAGEAQSTTTSSSGDVVFTFNVPTTAKLYTLLGARFRVSTQTGLGPDGAAPNGEVEDYVFSFNPPMDWGDLPDNGTGVPGTLNYSTLISTTGASHPMIPGLQLGANEDGELEGQPSALANGDDISPTLTPDDEGGVTFPPQMVLGQSAVITVTAINTTGVPAVLYGFIDFNANGFLTDTGELVTLTVPGNTSALTPFALTYNVPTGAVLTSSLGARFRLSTDTNLSAVGTASNGEVEDYLVSLAPPVSLGNRVWFDTNNNGIVDAGETNVPGVAMELYFDTDSSGNFSAADQLVSQTLTNAGGYYTFTNLPPTFNDATRYIVVVTRTNFMTGPLMNYLNSAGTITGNDRDKGLTGLNGSIASSVLSMTAGTQPTGDANEGNDPIQAANDANSNQTIDFGFYRLQLGNRVWVDANRDGLDNNSELGLANVPVTLTDSIGTVISTTMTDASGLYTFTNVPSGTYRVQILAPAGYDSTTPDDTTGNTDLNDNGQGTTSGVISSQVFALTPGVSSGAIVSSNVNGTTRNPSIDFGLTLDAFDLGNRVWYDTNNNGVLDAGEQPIASVVMLVRNIIGTVIATTTTDASGYYSFTGLAAGTYTVVVAASNFQTGGVLGGFWNSSATTAPSNTAGDNNRDHGINPATYAGYLANGVSSGSVTLGLGLPTNEDASAPATANGDPANNLTIDFGFYRQQIGNRVWNDANRDGLDNNGELGVSGVPVTLTDSIGNVISTTTTDASGFYTFTGVPSGTFIVQIQAPAGFVGTSPDDATGNTDLNDNGVGTTGGIISSPAFTLTPGTNSGAIVATNADGTTRNPSIDFGIFALFSLGNRVWFDTDNDGVDNDSGGGAPGTGVAGATVNLQTVTGTLVTTTDGQGYYRFDNLPAGTYTVVLPASNFAPGGPLVNYHNSDPAFSSTSTDLNDNGSESGVLGAGGVVRSGPITLGAGAQPTGETTSGSLNGGNGPQGDAADNLSVDFGFYKLVLGNQVWEDYDNDGVIDANEPGLAGVTVGLYSGGVLVSQTTTNGAGFYTFTNLVSGTYTMSVQAPVGYVSSKEPTSGNTPDNNTDSDDNGTGTNGGSVTSPAFNLTPGNEPSAATVDGATATTSNPTLDFGLFRPASLGNYVWLDVNGNGTNDEPASQGVNGVAATLFISTPIGWQQISQTTTTNDLGGNPGYYTFTNLISGTYYVSFTSPSQYTFTNQVGGVNVANNSDADRLTGATQPVTLNASDVNPNVDAGLLPRTVRLGNQVWFDADNDGTLDGGEQGPNGVAVQVYRDTNGDGLYTPGTDQLISNTTTSNGGFYTFTGLAEGSYVVVLTSTNFAPGGPLAGYVSSAGQGVADGDVDGNDDGAPIGTLGNGGFIASRAVTLTVGSEPNTTLVNGDSNFSVDFGVYKLELGNRIWEDVNNNGLFDVGESVIPNVTVELRDSAGSTVLSTTTTNASGYYTFTGLPEGSYVVVLPASNFTGVGVLRGYTSSSGINGSASGPYEPGIGESNTLSDENKDHGSVNGALGSGGDVRSGVVVLGLGTEPLNNAAQALSQQPTMDFGVYRPMNLGNQVWNDPNNNGLLDGGEVGIGGVTVRLYDATNPTTPMLTTTTTSSGFYTFTNLTTGNYIVEVDRTSAPLIGLRSSSDITSSANPNNDINNDDNGVNVTTTTVRSNVVQLQPTTEPNTTTATGDSNFTVDFGFFLPRVNLGNQVWFDANANGTLDGSEQGVSGVAVQLYQDTNGDGIYTPGIDQFINSTTTQAGGFYSFTNLNEGSYVVVLTSTNFAPNAVLGGYVSSPGQGTADLDTDNNDDGAFAGLFGNGYVSSKAITLTVGNEPSTTTASNDSNFTVDFGFYKLELGNLVWNDVNNNGVLDNGELPIANVSVELRDAATNALISSTTTNASGYYTFTGLDAGNYRVILTSTNFVGGGPLVGFTSSIGGNTEPGVAETNDLSRDGVDHGSVNGALGSGGFIQSGPIALQPNTEPITNTAQALSQQPTIDFGVYQPKMILGNLVWADTNNDGQLGSGELGLVNIAVELYADTNGDNVFTPGIDQPISSTTTNASGFYTFSNINPGPYFVVITTTNFTSGPLQNYQSSGPTGVADSNTDNDDDGNTAPAGYVASSVINLQPTTEPLTTTQTGDTNNTVDFGFYKLELGNLVWEDFNNNGLVDSGEPGISSVTVELLDGSGTNVLSTTTTNASGNYTFTNLTPGNYRVRVTPPAGYKSSTGINGAASGPYEPGIGESNTLADENKDHGTANGALVTSGLITLTAGAEPIVNNATGYSAQPTVDFGLFQPARVGDYVWYDSNHDGQQGSPTAEPGVGGVTVTLFSNGTPVSTTFTDGSGAYSFTNLISGTYSVTFVLPAPLTYTLSSANPNPTGSNTDSDATSMPGSPQQGTTGSFVLPYGGTQSEIDAGVWQPAGLGDFVWFDSNSNGLQDVGEPGVGGVVATLFILSDTQYVQISQTVTQPNSGYYQFPQLISGTYVVVFTPPPGYTFTLPTAGSPISDSNVLNPLGQTGPIVLNAGEFDVTVDAGLVAYAGLGDYVWEDINHNGLQDPSEPGVPNVPVTLYQGGSPISSTTTNGTGYYSFTGLISGTYTVGFGLPTGFTYTVQLTSSTNTVMGIAPTDSNVTNMSTGGTAPIVVNWNTFNPDIDAGLWRPASLGDFVWEDVNGDGQQGVSEPGVNGVTVTLLSALDNSVISTTTTTNVGGQDGYYTFTNLISGSYYVVFSTPPGYAFTRQDVGNDVSDSDPLTSTGRTGNYALFPGNSIPTVDAGLVRPASLGDRVWEDLDHDGVQDLNEPGIPNVTVVLYDVTNTPIATTTTGVGGLYTFTNLFPGAYSVGFGTPNAYTPTVTSGNPNDPLNNDADPNTGRTQPVTLISGENNPNLDAGYWRPASLGDYVWVDTDGDGQQDVGETGLNGVVVTLFDDEGSVVSSTVTYNFNGQNGYYTFTNLISDTYAVRFTAPNGYTFTKSNEPLVSDASDSDPNRTNGMTGNYVLNAGESNPTVDAGLVQLASLGNFVWDDLNYNGVQDPGEPGVSGVTVVLYDVTHTPVQTTTTNAQGTYSFTNIFPGVYSVGFVPPAPYTYTVQNGPANNPTNSDPNPTTGQTPQVFLQSGENNPNLDAGLYKPASLGDYVWQDSDRDGVQEVGEPPIPNVTVQLLDANGTVISSTTTNASGLYSFTNLVPGVYAVAFVMPPGGYLPTVQTGAVNNATNSDADVTTGRTATATLQSGDYNPNLDAGYWLPATLGNYVWSDNDRDGVQDEGEPPLPNVTVQLLDASGTVIGTTTTNVSGLYTFTNLVPGEYSVRFTAPNGFTFTTPGSTPSSDTDSNPNSTGRTPAVTLQPGDNNLTIDAGLIPLASLGNFVWDDSNANGIQDGNEPGVPGATVQLFDGNGQVVGTQQTDMNGFYIFTNLIPGTYVVVFTAPDGYTLTVQGNNPTGSNNSDSNPDRLTGSVPPVTLQPGENNLTIDAGLNTLARLGDFVWLDANRNGVQDSGEPGVANVVVTLFTGRGQPIMTVTTDANGQYLFDNLSPDDYYVKFTLPTGYTFTQQGAGTFGSDSNANPVNGQTVQTTIEPGENDRTWDAGLYGLGGLGDQVFLDSNGNGRQAPNEEWLFAVPVTLTLPGGQHITTTTTVTGYYHFDDLPAGRYTVTVSPQPNYSSTTPLTQSVNVGIGQDVTTVDFGFLPLPTLQIRKTAATKDPAVKVGDFITYTLVVSNSGPGVAQNVVITDPLPSDLEYVANSAVPAATYTNRTLRWTKATLGVRERYTMTFVAKVLPSNTPSATQIVNVGYTQATMAGVPSNGPQSPLQDDDLAPVPRAPTAITLKRFTAKWLSETVLIQWETGSEKNTFGFLLYRSETADRSKAKRITTDAIPAQVGNGDGASYAYEDETATPGKVYYYWLQEVETDGDATDYGPAGTDGTGVGKPDRFVVFLPLLAKK